ncbi:MAG: cadherin domain-containing protein, partial [Aureliella sp.]
MTINATTDDSFAVNSNRPAIVIDGNDLAADGFVLSSTADGSEIRGFVIRNFGGDGIEIQAGSDNNTIAGNYIGSLYAYGSSAGSYSVNSGSGIRILGANNTIGGTGSLDGNVISGNSSNGVTITGASATGNILRANEIGTDSAGSSSVANGGAGVYIDGGASSNRIGSAGYGNLISGNTSNGLVISGSTTNNNIIQANTMGANFAQTIPISNGAFGIYIDQYASGTLIGTDLDGSNDSSEGNAIGGNSGSTGSTAGGGIYLQALSTIIRGNAIAYNGRAVTTSAGIVEGGGSSGIIIGGTATGAGNSIFNNTGDGIIVSSTATGVVIEGNSIYGNSQMGIDLGNDGVTSNDTNDGDTGANNLQNYPVITGAVVDGGKLSVTGTLNSNSNKTYRIEFFANSSSDGEGQRYLGYIDVTTPSSSPYTTSFSTTLSASVTAGEYITATATSPNDNTSEFSASFRSHSSTGLLLSSTGSTSTSQISYGQGELIQFADPNLVFEPGTTSGTLISTGLNLSSFAADGSADIDGIHYVSSTVVVGGAHAVTLLAGDILFSVSSNETLGGVAVSTTSIAMFRPTTAGDYSSGTFMVLLDNPMNGYSVRDFALVERTMVVGGTTLNAGDFLITASGYTYSMDVTRYVVSDVGVGTTAGTRSLFVNGSAYNTNFDSSISGLDLVQNTATLGGKTFTAGQLLISLSGSDTVGNNGLSVTAYDIFTLDLSATGTYSSGSASLLVQGSDIGLSYSGEEIDGISLMSLNSAPVLDASKSPVLTAVNEDAGPPSGAVGTLISSLVDFASPSGQVDNVTDSNAGAQLGVAITAASTANGSWWYSTDNGASWNSLGNPSGAASRLLAADSNTRIYFQANANFNGSISSALTFRAWDRTTGTNGGTADTTANGGTSAFSTATDTASLVVTAVNDAPTAVSDSASATEAGGTNNGTAGTNPSGNVLTNDSDVDSGDTRSVCGVAAGTVGSASGSVGVTVTGTYGSITVASNGAYTYTVDQNNATVQALRTSGQSINDVFTYTIQDAGGLKSTTQVTVAIHGANDAPYDLTMPATTIAENLANGSLVQTVTASDVDSGDGFTYQLTDNAGGRFAIDSATGKVTVADSSKLNYEAATSHTITVRVTDTAGATYDESFTISLSDVDEFDVSAIGDTNASANMIAENAAIGSAVGITASASDADATTNGITYSLLDNDGGRFSIDSATGVVKVAAAIDREADGASRTITVRATSADGSTSDQNFTIAITDVDECNTSAVTDSNVAADSVAENSAIGTVVGVTASASDADATTNGITYSLVDNDGGRFSIDSATGVVKVAGAIDREADGASRTITVRATSADGSTSDQNFTIAITDVDEFNTSAVTDTNAAADSVAENAAIGTVVGITASASDADATTNGVTYSLVDDDGGRFSIDSATGVVKVAAAIDREADGASRTITVRATSADGSTSDQNFAIAITDVDEFDTTAVSDMNPAVDSVAENAAVGTAVGIVAAASDADATNSTITYSLVDNDGGRFSIDSATGVVKVAGAIDREADGASRTITVRATSADGSSTEQDFTIAISDVNEFATSPTSDVDSASNTVNENAAVGTLVGVTAAANDADATTNSVVYSLIDDDGGRFAIDSATGVVTVAGAIDREADGASRSITVRASSADGSFNDQTFNIAIGDLDEFDTGAVSDADASVNIVDENAAVGTSVGVSAAASDADSTNSTITYTLLDDDGGRFAIDSSTGIVTVAGAIDREADGATRSITVRATSADGSTSDTTFNIAIADVDEFDTTPVADADASADSVAENAAAGTQVGIDASASDADATTNSVTYSLVDDDGGRFAIDSATGVVTVAGSIDRESDGATRNITVRATSADGSTSDRTFSISIDDIDEFDVTPISDADIAANTVAENSAIGTVVGVTASASDGDVTSNVVAYSLVDDDGGRFAIDSATGVVTVAGAIDRETLGASRNITVRATSADGSTSDKTFTIAIADVDEFDTSAVADTSATANSVSENAANGTLVGITAAASDADATNNTITYSLDNDAGGRFAIDSNTGVVTVANGSLLNYEAASSHNLTVRATSADGSFQTSSFTVAVKDVNEYSISLMSDVDFAADVVAENSAAGTLVGIRGQAIDADGTNNTVTYSLVDNAGGRFAIDAASGQVSVAAGANLNYEAASVHTISIKATSADGSSTTSAYVIGVLNVNEAPTMAGRSF